jgi:hypothetical protein
MNDEKILDELTAKLVDRAMEILATVETRVLTFYGGPDHGEVKRATICEEKVLTYQGRRFAEYDVITDMALFTGRILFGPDLT